MQITSSLGTAVMVSIVAASPLFAQGRAEGSIGSGSRSAAHVRGLDSMAVTLLDEGAARSATFRRLAERLENLDVVVWVTTGFVSEAPAKVAIVGAAHGWRLLRITISVQNVRNLLLAHLAHELQHAVEIATNPTVVDAATLQQDYWTHGNQVGQNGWCTSAAQKVRAAVAFEVGKNR